MEEIETKRKQQARQSRTGLISSEDNPYTDTNYEYSEDNKNGTQNSANNPYKQKPLSAASGSASEEVKGAGEGNDSEEFEVITRQDVGSDDEPVDGKQRKMSGSAADQNGESDDDNEFIMLPADKKKQKKKRTKMKML